MSQAYSDLKAAWHLEKIRDLRIGWRIAPAQVQLILSDLCNQNCSFCSYRMDAGLSTERFKVVEDGKLIRNPNRRIPTEKALEILDDCKEAGVLAIQFTGGGEPTVHPDHMKIFGRALDHGMKASLVTNGVLFKDGWRQVFPRFDWVRVSVDSHDAGHYAELRQAPREHFAKAISHIESLAQEIDRQGSACLLGIGYVVTPQNYKHIKDAVGLFEKTGAANVRLSAMFSTEGTAPYAGVYEEIQSDIAHAVDRYQRPGFDVINLFGNRISDLEQHAPDYHFCGYQHFNVYIGGNLEIYRCCSTAYTEHGLIGDLKEKRFRDWLRDDAVTTDLYKFDAATCNTCQFNGKNRLINYLIDEHPQHVEFV